MYKVVVCEVRSAGSECLISQSRVEDEGGKVHVDCVLVVRLAVGRIEVSAASTLAIRYTASSLRWCGYHCSSIAGSVDGGGGEELMASCLRKRAKLSSARRRFVSS